MAVTVNVQSNPTISNIGKSLSDATIISSGLTGTVTYQVRKRDHSESFTIRSNTSVSNYPQVVSISAAQLKIILPGRQLYEARANNGGAWTAWTQFKTRDKTFWTPLAGEQGQTNFDTNPTVKTNKTITNTNVGKSTVTYTSGGATVTNSDKWYNGTTSITETPSGATIVNNV